MPALFDGSFDRPELLLIFWYQCLQRAMASCVSNPPVLMSTESNESHLSNSPVLLSTESYGYHASNPTEGNGSHALNPLHTEIIGSHASTPLHTEINGSHASIPLHTESNGSHASNSVTKEMVVASHWAAVISQWSVIIVSSSPQLSVTSTHWVCDLHQEVHQLRSDRQLLKVTEGHSSRPCYLYIKLKPCDSQSIGKTLL